jgi:uncharacterized protein (DUF1800 family)
MEAMLAKPKKVKELRSMPTPTALEAEQLRRAEERKQMYGGKAGKAGAEKKREAEKDIAAQDNYARLFTASKSARPFNERLALFWCNHFTVSGASAKTRALVGAFEREAIRPHIAGSFEDLLRSSTLHPAMLLYLDNQRSVGPHSASVMRLPAGSESRKRGLNENLAREVMELHTLGAESSRAAAGQTPVYTQADVTAFASVLTGWTTNIQPGSTDPVEFEAGKHEPGEKRLLGKTYPEGPKALGMVLHDLALHPATAHFVATKLARHFIADDPPASLVDKLKLAYLNSQGDLPTVYRALIAAPESWKTQLGKLKTPEEFAISSARLLQLGDGWLQRPRDGGVTGMGQALQRAPSPAGWSDRAEDWLGPEAVWKRIEWADRLVDHFGGAVDARSLAVASLGPLLTPGTAQQIDRAADGKQALTLLLLAPEFQRR